MSIKRIALGLCAAAFLCGTASATEVGANGSVGPAPWKATQEDPPCGYPAQCIPLCVEIPNGSKITGYRFGARNSDPSFPWINCENGGRPDCGQTPFARFTDPYLFYQASNHAVYCSVFKNWSDSYGRDGYVNAKYE